MPLISKVSKKRYSWAAPGDVNAFFGLMLDNIADLVLTVGLLTAIFGFPAIFALRYMVPGTAIGVLVGDLLFFAMALRVARRTGRNDITAMPLGLDTPSTFGMVFFVLGPAFLTAKFEQGLSEQAAASYAWHIGICCIVISGVFKLLCACGSQWVRNLVPRAGLLGSLTAIALVLICFLPLLDILQYPVVGLAALAVILTTLVAKVAAPLRIPGALAALLVGGTIYYVMASQGWLGAESAGTLADPAAGLFPTEWTTAFRFEWMAAWGDALRYLPIVIPFALATVIGGIDCTESAAAAGDEFDTNQVIGVEAIATLVAGLCGGVIQSTPYIGHPAYKAMGGRSAYVLATALFVGGAGLIGYFGVMYTVIPKSAVFPILVFIGIEITAQSFRATPTRHFPALAIACIPALAVLAVMFADQLQGQYADTVGGLNRAIAGLQESPPGEWGGTAAEDAWQQIQQCGEELRVMSGDFSQHPPQLGEPHHELGQSLQTLRMLSNGFIITSLLWASALAALIDRRLRVAAAFFLVAAGFALFGIIHSPMPGGPLVLPWQLPTNLPANAAGQTPFYMASAYAIVASILVLWSLTPMQMTSVRHDEGMTTD